MMERFSIAADGLRAQVLAQGAELCSLTDKAGREMMWQAGPAWPRHAPVLFPIVGRLGHDRLRHGGHDYPMTQHGFARDRLFNCIAQDAASVRLELRDDADTRAKYPFGFRFELTFQLAEGALTVTYSAANTGDETMPVAMGAHPAFRWPLADGVAKSAHILTFEANEPAPMPRVSGGLLGPSINASLIEAGVLRLDESLFATDALILPAPVSRSVRYTAPDGPPGTPGIEMRWDGFSCFGIWMKPGADFLCLEPWTAMASPQDWDGVLADKPGMALLSPGQRLEASYRLRLMENGE